MKKIYLSPSDQIRNLYAAGGAEFDIDNAELKIEIEAGNFTTRST